MLLCFIACRNLAGKGKIRKGEREERGGDTFAAIVQSQVNHVVYSYSNGEGCLPSLPFLLICRVLHVFALPTVELVRRKLNLRRGMRLMYL